MFQADVIAHARAVLVRSKSADVVEVEEVKFLECPEVLRLVVVEEVVVKLYESLELLCLVAMFLNQEQTLDDLMDDGSLNQCLI